MACVRRSVPDAIAALKVPDSVLRNLAEAKVQEVLTAWLTVEGTAGGEPGAGRS